MSKTPVDLAQIPRRQLQLLSEMETLRDYMGFLIGMVQGLDDTMSGLVNEVRATRARQGCLMQPPPPLFASG